VAGRARAADAGSLEIELRALLNLGWLEFVVGNLAPARAAFDEGAELADRAGLGWSDFGITIRRGQCYVRFEAGDWDECERLAGAIPDLVTNLAVAELAAAALHVEVGRGRVTAPRRLRDLATLAGLDFNAAVEVAGLEADQATWQGDLERASSAVQRVLAIFDDSEIETSQNVDLAWICAIGLAVQAEIAGRARATGNALALADATTDGHLLLERAHEAVE
jgi:hypothetical protein